MAHNSKANDNDKANYSVNDFSRFWTWRENYFFFKSNDNRHIEKFCVFLLYSLLSLSLFRNTNSPNHFIFKLII